MQNLFSDFKPASAAEWRAKVLADLKAANFDDLLWRNENGFDISPFYTGEDLKGSYEPAFTHSSWEIVVKGNGGNAVEMNRTLLQGLEGGATAISLEYVDLDLNTVLRDIQLGHIHSTFCLLEKDAKILADYLAKNYKVKEPQISLLPQKLFTPDDLEQWAKTILFFAGHKGIKTVAADILHFHNRNCLAFYEIAIALSCLVEQLEFLSQKKQIPAADLVVRTGANSDFFLQIAKFRALRRLWNVVKKEYKLNNDIHLIVETSLTNKSISDNYNNLLRTSVESMAAVLGGGNELCVNDFDLFYARPNSPASRLGINQQLVLREECYLDKMADVACGSYYIETITDALAKRALEQFKVFEKEGGYFACIKSGLIEGEIHEQARDREAMVKDGRQIVIGVNKFRNEKEKIELESNALNNLKELSINNPALQLELGSFFSHA